MMHRPRRTPPPSRQPQRFPKTRSAASPLVLGLLTDEDVDWLATHGVDRTLAAGEIALRGGDPLPSIMLVLEGAMLATSTLPSLPDERRVDGDVIGIVAVIDGGASPWTVEVLEPSVVLELENTAPNAKLELDLGFASRFYRAMAVIVAGRCALTSGSDGDSLEAPQAFKVNTYLAAACIEPPRLAAKDGLSLVSANSASVGHAALLIARAIDPVLNERPSLSVRQRQIS